MPSKKGRLALNADPNTEMGSMLLENPSANWFTDH